MEVTIAVFSYAFRSSSGLLSHSCHLVSCIAICGWSIRNPGQNIRVPLQSVTTVGHVGAGSAGVGGGEGVWGVVQRLLVIEVVGDGTR